MYPHSLIRGVEFKTCKLIINNNNNNKLIIKKILLQNMQNQVAPFPCKTTHGLKMRQTKLVGGGG